MDDNETVSVMVKFPSVSIKVLCEGTLVKRVQVNFIHQHEMSLFCRVISSIMNAKVKWAPDREHKVSQMMFNDTPLYDPQFSSQVPVTRAGATQFGTSVSSMDIDIDLFLGSQVPVAAPAMVNPFSSQPSQVQPSFGVPANWNNYCRELSNYETNAHPNAPFIANADPISHFNAIQSTLPNAHPGTYFNAPPNAHFRPPSPQQALCLLQDLQLSLDCQPGLQLTSAPGEVMVSSATDYSVAPGGQSVPAPSASDSQDQQVDLGSKKIRDYTDTELLYIMAQKLKDQRFIQLVERMEEIASKAKNL